MVYYALDTETAAIKEEQRHSKRMTPARPENMVCCVIQKEKTKNPKVFTEPEQAWEYLKKEGDTNGRSGHNTYIYMHNNVYDIHTIGLNHLHEPNVKKTITKHAYMINIDTKHKSKGGKPLKIYFLDTYKLFKTKLNKIGQLMGFPKTNTPETLTGKNRKLKSEITKKELEEIIKYCKQDTLIVLKLIERLKKELMQKGLTSRKLFTRGQVINSSFLNYVEKKPYSNQIFSKMANTHKGKRAFHTIFKKYNEKKAYRAGRSEVFQLGEFGKVWSFDQNSCYPYMATKIPFPRLDRQTIVKKPLIFRNIQHYNNRYMGTATAIIQLEPQKIGLLPVKQAISVPFEAERQEQIFPVHKCRIMGTWTIAELAELEKKKTHKILDIYEAILYKKATHNPLKEFIEEIYPHRLENGFNNIFYKGMLTDLFGKFAETREDFGEGDQTIMVDWAKRHEWRPKGYSYTGNRDGRLAEMRKEGRETSIYTWAAIIPIYINAYARLQLQPILEQINTKDLLKTEVDSVQMLNGEKYEHLFPIGDKLGQWRIQYQNTKAEFRSKKDWAIYNAKKGQWDIKKTGIPEKDKNYEDWKKGKLIYERQLRYGSKGTTKETAGYYEQITYKYTDLEKEIQETTREDISLTQTLTDTKELERGKIMHCAKCNTEFLDYSLTKKLACIKCKSEQVNPETDKYGKARTRAKPSEAFKYFYQKGYFKEKEIDEMEV